MAPSASREGWLRRRARRDRRSGDRLGQVVILNWRDSWHPEGGGSETYVARSRHGCSERGDGVTIFTARYPGAARSEVRDGIRYLRRGGHLTVYLWAALHLLAGRFGALGEVHRSSRCRTACRSCAGCFTRADRSPSSFTTSTASSGRSSARCSPRVGWFMESRVAVRVNRGLRYIAVSDVTRTELVDLGVRPQDIVIALNGLLPHPRTTCSPRIRTRTSSWSRLVATQADRARHGRRGGAAGPPPEAAPHHHGLGLVGAGAAHALRNARPGGRRDLPRARDRPHEVRGPVKRRGSICCPR